MSLGSNLGSWRDVKSLRWREPRVLYCMGFQQSLVSMYHQRRPGKGQGLPFFLAASEVAGMWRLSSSYDLEGMRSLRAITWQGKHRVLFKDGRCKCGIMNDFLSVVLVSL